MADVIYPLFLREEGNYFCLIRSLEHLNYRLEENDVEEYTGWDSAGRPLSLYYENKRIHVHIDSDTNESEKLKQAVMNYVKTYVNSEGSYPDDVAGDLVRLLEWTEKKAEEHWKAKRIRVRLKNIFLRFFGKQN